MSKKITFCEECRKDVDYTQIDVKLENGLKGEIYSYMGKKAICSQCGSEVYVPDVDDFNLKELYDEYRRKNCIISLERILEIPKKYNIGKRPLSLLLGWGEMTFSRYCEGYMPTKQYSDILQKILDDAMFYISILESNKENLKSSLAYEKSKQTTEILLGNQRQANSKIDDVITYLFAKCEDVTPLALQKALYYIQGFYYAFMDKFIFDEDCEAWVHGPVYRDVYSRYSNYRYDPIDGSYEFNDSIFTESEKAVIESVIKNFCCYSGKTLEKFTHSEVPWLKTRGDLAATVLCNRIIDKKLIGEYFITVKQKFNMINPADIETYAEAIFKQIN